MQELSLIKILLKLKQVNITMLQQKLIRMLIQDISLHTQPVPNKLFVQQGPIKAQVDQRNVKIVKVVIIALKKV